MLRKEENPHYRIRDRFLKEYDPVWVLEEQCKVRQVMANFKYRQYNNNAAAMQYCGIRLNIKKL
jgi:hypothetical protein